MVNFVFANGDQLFFFTLLCLQYNDTAFRHGESTKKLADGGRFTRVKSVTGFVYTQICTQTNNSYRSSLRRHSHRRLSEVFRILFSEKI